MKYFLEIDTIIETIYELLLEEELEELLAERLLTHYHELKDQGQLHVEFESELKL